MRPQITPVQEFLPGGSEALRGEYIANGTAHFEIVPDIVKGTPLYDVEVDEHTVGYGFHTYTDAANYIITLANEIG